MTKPGIFDAATTAGEGSGREIVVGAGIEIEAETTTGLAIGAVGTGVGFFDGVGLTAVACDARTSGRELRKEGATVPSSYQPSQQP